MKKPAVILLASLLALASVNAFAEDPAQNPPPAQAPGPAPAQAPTGATPPPPPVGQAAAPMHKGKGMCAQDIQTLCPGVQKGEGRIQKCLDQHSDQVSAACKADRAQRKAENKAVKASCKADIKQFCADAKGGGGAGVMQCLSGHAAQLSPDCAKALNDTQD